MFHLRLLFIFVSPFACVFVINDFSAFQVSGIVRGSDIAGKLPTKDATISWFLVDNPQVSGITSTDADGKYEFLVQVCYLKKSFFFFYISHDFLCCDPKRKRA